MKPGQIPATPKARAVNKANPFYFVINQYRTWNQNRIYYQKMTRSKIFLIIFHRPDRWNHSQCPKNILSLFPQNPKDCHTFQTLYN